MNHTHEDNYLSLFIHYHTKFWSIKSMKGTGRGGASALYNNCYRLIDTSDLVSLQVTFRLLTSERYGSPAGSVKKYFISGEPFSCVDELTAGGKNTLQDHLSKFLHFFSSVKTLQIPRRKKSCGKQKLLYVCETKWTVFLWQKKSFYRFQKN